MSSKPKNRSGRRRAPRGRKALPLVAAPPVSSRVMMTGYLAATMTEAAVSLGATYWFRLNSVYDPDYTGVGTTAVPYGTWSAIFNNYKVKRCTMRISCTYVGLAGSFANVTLAPLANNPVVPTNPATWKMIPGAHTKTISNATDGGQNVCTIEATWDMARVARVTKQQFDADMDFSGAIGTNPTRQIYGGLLFWPVGSTVAGKLTFNVNLTYEVEWFNPIALQ